MKALKISFICFFILSTIAIFWIDDNIPFQSVYWLIGKLTCLFIYYIGLVFIPFKSTDNKKSSIISRACLYLVLIGFYGYKQIATYNRNVCQDKFGWAFNKTRRILGTPQIPYSWHISSRGSHSVGWEKIKNDTLGHISKDIFIDSICRIKLEYDDYHFKTKNGVSRDLSITTKYARGKGVDSINYFYEIGNDNKEISRQQADSIFASEKISKDY